MLKVRPSCLRSMYKPFVRLMTPRLPHWVVERLFIGYRDVYSGFEDTLGVGWV